MPNKQDTMTQLSEYI